MTSSDFGKGPGLTSNVCSGHLRGGAALTSPALSERLFSGTRSPGALGNLHLFSPSCPYLARELTLAIPIIAAILFFFVMSCLLQTSFTDPGILPRATICEAAALEKQIGEALTPSPC